MRCKAVPRSHALCWNWMLSIRTPDRTGVRSVGRRSSCGTVRLDPGTGTTLPLRERRRRPQDDVCFAEDFAAVWTHADRVTVRGAGRRW